MHRPVLLKEVLESLKIKKNGLYIDGTFGEGGHGIEIIKKGGFVLGIEWDKKQYEKQKIRNKKYLKNNKLILVNENFAEIERIAKENNFFPVDGILFDLGLSMWQLNNSGKGFSFKKLEEELDMRLNEVLNVKASDLVNSLPINKLYEIFTKYSEEVNSLRLAQAIISARKVKKIITVGDLIKIIDEVIGKNEKVYARVFQSLRIAVNDELNNLRKALEGSLKILKRNGKIAIISFHSLEDRLIKKFIKEKSLFLEKKIIGSKGKFKFERSAKLRVITFKKINEN